MLIIGDASATSNPPYSPAEVLTPKTAAKPCTPYTSKSQSRGASRGVDYLDAFLVDGEHKTGTFQSKDASNGNDVHRNILQESFSSIHGVRNRQQFAVSGLGQQKSTSRIPSRLVPVSDQEYLSCIAGSISTSKIDIRRKHPGAGHMSKQMISQYKSSQRKLDSRSISKYDSTINMATGAGRAGNASNHPSGLLETN